MVWASLSDVRALEHVSIAAGDLVAVSIPPSPAWLELVTETWAAGAAVLPVDHRLPPAEAGALLERARPTVVLEAGGSRRVDGRPTEPDIALIVHTIGTQGSPKLAQFHRRAIDAAVASSALALEASDEDRWLCCLPLSHVGGLLVLLRSILLGAPVAVHSRFDPEAVMAEHGVEFTSVVPTMLGRLVETGADLSSFRAILVGGAHLSPDLRTRAERAGANVVETYGLTETCGGVVYEVLRPGPSAIDARAASAPGPTLMQCRSTRQDPLPRSRGGMVVPGTRRDRPTRAIARGSIDDLINTGGERVWPDQVEAALGPPRRPRCRRNGPRTAHVAVWVVPDPADPPSLEELRAFAARTLPRYAAPRELTLADRLPRTLSGKLRRAALPRD
jgi:O-succinylbenzoic acid--CoA ligase